MNLYVGNLSATVSEQDLRSAFEPFGQIREVRLITDKSSGQSQGYGFVEFPSKNDAEKAVDELDGKDFLGRIVTVHPAKPKTHRRACGRNRGRGHR